MNIFIPLRLKLILYTLFFIIITISIEYMAINYFKTSNTTIILLVIIALTLFISLYILDKIINAPITRILQKIDKLTNGDYSNNKDIKEKDELSLIYNKFNEMAKQIDKREQDLDNIVHQDLLTKIPNRTMLNERLEYALNRAKRQKSKLAVLFIDIDDFKNINDTLGHDIGDKLLLHVSNQLVQAMRKNDLLARIGGDEFNVLIEDLESPEDAQKIARKLINNINIPVSIDENAIHVSASIGISIFPIDADSSSKLLKNADLAMYDAKQDGKNKYKFFSQELSINLKKKTEMLQELKQAIFNDELVLYYQPKFSFKTNSIYGAEALIRWKSKKLGFLSPDSFIPLAEESAEILEIGRWVINTACSDLSNWRSLGLDIKQVSINVSNVQFEKDDVVKLLKNAIDRYFLKPGNLEVEITESYIHKNSDKALKTLHSIRDIGVDLAMDDFGTGYSSMSYLKKLPLTRLKIDKAFIDDLPHNNDAAAITKVIVELAKIMNLSTTAEGIETLEQMNFLKEIQCDEGQGYICSKPLPANEFIEFIKNNPTFESLEF